MIDLFNVFQLFKDFHFEFIRKGFEFFILSALYANDFEFFKAVVFSLEYVVVKIERYWLEGVGVFQVLEVFIYLVMIRLGLRIR